MLFFSRAAAAEPAPGAAVFARWCAHCLGVGPGNPGTQRLGWNQGPERALLEARTDLSADYVRRVVRNGLAEMPSFRITEIPAGELDALAAHLAKEPPRPAPGRAHEGLQ
jgi:mono/diheme cytochrome c family protein